MHNKLKAVTRAHGRRRALVERQHILAEDANVSIRHYQDLAAEEQRLLASLDACQKQQQQAYVQLEGVVARPSTAS